MTRLKLGGIALISVVVVGAIASGTAFAVQPEFVPANAGVTVKAKSKGAVTLKNVTNATVISCTSDSSSGILVGSTNPKGVEKITVTFSGCSAAKKGTSCGEAKTKGGMTLGQIKTNLLTGELGPVAPAEAPSEVGFKLAPESPATKFVEIEFAKNTTNGLGPCVASAVAKGSIVGEVPVAFLNIKSEMGELVFEENASGTQKIKKFAGGPAELELFGNKTSALVTTEEVKFGEELEVTGPRVW